MPHGKNIFRWRGDNFSLDLFFLEEHLEPFFSLLYLAVALDIPDEIS